MLFLMMLTIVWIGVSLGLTILTHMYEWWIALWVVSGLLSGIIFDILFVFIFIEIGSRTTPKSKFKVFVLKSALELVFWYNHTKVTCEGVENVPYNAPFVMYCNHKSMLDPAAIYVKINRIVSAIGKKSLWGFWPMNRICECFGALPMDRDNDRQAVKDMLVAIKAVKEGMPMIIFPEGGIKNRDVEEMVNLRAGAYKLAMKAEAPIIPVAIMGSSEISKKKRFEKKHIHIIFHKPITKEEYKDKNTTEVGTYVEELINEDIRKYEEL